ncbi:nuclear transport factor 2 family protein [Myxosarcina sp. GI1]|uniref:nuclear transport factor 2 family protein n=1 Tax=Myxosarcina sp. GI1 TaxID=1541065 RepID=UPI00056B1919|nr:nuclear transport factor 2 family protein [Myxosarcina sp. GI1]
MTDSDNSELIATAQKAYNYFSHGLATGSWTDFLAMLSDDFTFSFPIEPFKGKNVGREKAAQFFYYVSEKVFSNGLFLTLERITSNETTVVFEVRSSGLMFGEPYQNQVAISFDVRGDRICGYREYLGVIYQSNRAK